MSDDSAFRKILRLIGRDGSVPERLRGRLERKDEYLIGRGAYLFEELVKSSRGKNNSFRIFSLKELQKATNNFSEDLYLRGFSRRTYRGTIEDRHVAMRIHYQPHSLLNEVVSLSLIKHRNVVKLLGFCLETIPAFLVHELPPNRTLRENIFHEKHPSVEFLWTDRLRIAMEIADALSYLHSELHMTHGGLEADEAVLLDEFHSAKLGSFQHSKIQNQAESSDVETDFRNKRRKRYDVYRFGGILLNLLGIDKSDYCYDKVSEKEILKYVKRLNVSEKEMPQVEACIIEDRHVAVKILEGFLINEVISLSLIKHRNVVKLLGCCLETEDPIVVLELPPNGTLRENISKLLWTDRLRIATEIADALAYLHSELHMTHGRLWWKSAVLLDEFHSAKLGSFQHSKIQNQAESSDVETDFRNKRRKRHDVYRFGVILLNLLGIDKSDYCYDKVSEKEILMYVKRLNVSEKEMPQIEAYIDLLLSREDRGMEEVARELRRIRSM